MSIDSWYDLDFWETGEWQVLKERLDEMDKAKISYCPRRELLFASLDACPLDTVRVCLMGQDPYPDPKHATGLAFSIPKDCGNTFPPTLKNILTEWKEDLGKEFLPSHGDLSAWAGQGVLLWNSVPTCFANKPGSHRDWVEWNLLTQEIMQVLSERCIVFVLLGGWAKEYEKYIDKEANEIIRVAHPSPRASLGIKTAKPFKGSRIFSTTNAMLKKMKQPLVDWSL